MQENLQKSQSINLKFTLIAVLSEKSQRLIHTYFSHELWIRIQQGVCILQYVSFGRF